MLKKLAVLILYLVLFLLSFLLFFLLLLPLDRLETFIEDMAAKSGFVTVDIGEIEQDGLERLVFRDIEVTMDLSKLRAAMKKETRPVADATGTEAEKPEQPEKPDQPEQPEAAEQDDKGAPDSLVIDELVLGFGIVDLLTPNRIRLELEISLLGGTIEDTSVEFRRSLGYDHPIVEIGRIRDLDLAGAPLLAELFSTLMPSMKAESLTGTLETAFISARPMEPDEQGDETGIEAAPFYTGEVNLRVRNLTAVNPRLLLRYKHGGQEVQSEEFRLTDLRLGECNFEIRMGKPGDFKGFSPKQKKSGDSIVYFDRGDCSGDSIDYAVRKGSFIRIPPEGGPSQAHLDIWTKLAFSSEYFEEKLTENGVVVSQNDALDKAMRFQQGGFAKSRDVDGYNWMHCTGQVKQAKCKNGLPVEEKRKKTMEEERKRREEEAQRKVNFPAPRPQGTTNTFNTMPKPYKPTGKPFGGIKGVPLGPRGSTELAPARPEEPPLTAPPEPVPEPAPEPAPSPEPLPQDPVVQPEPEAAAEVPEEGAGGGQVDEPSPLEAAGENEAAGGGEVPVEGVAAEGTGEAEQAPAGTEGEAAPAEQPYEGVE